jgi:hypothetical protein
VTGSVRPTPEPAGGGLVRTDPEEKIEHTRVDGAGDRGQGRVASPGRIQLLQHLGDVQRVAVLAVAEADLVGGGGGRRA